MRKATLFWMMVLGFLVTVATASPSLAAYSAHQNDQDISNFLAVYPFAKSTKLDDCSLCHTSGKIGKKTYGSCDYCHQVYKTEEPHGDILATLNSFGLAYNDAGRDQAALATIEGSDSDADTFTNIDEIRALAFPGNSKDYPGLVPAPAIGMNFKELLKLPEHRQFLLFNASNSRDFYARYNGVKILDLLNHAGIKNNATQITVFSPDGYSMAFPIDVSDPQTDPATVQYDVKGPYPKGTYYGGFDFVDYSTIPGGLKDGDRIPDELHMLLAYLRDKDPLTIGKLVPDTSNPGTLKLDGEGPYRLIPPQKIAGSPDRGCKETPVGDGWDCDNSKNHNAGSSARTVAAIRVDPLPDGTTDFDWYEGGWNLVDKAKLVIYGAIKPPTYTVNGKVSEASSGNGVPDVKLVFSLLSLANVAETTTSSASGNKKSGEFQKTLPVGEYTVVPSKEGCTFTPAPLLISIPYSDSDSKYDIYITATCAP
jgi:hypothetical protein